MALDLAFTQSIMGLLAFYIGFFAPEREKPTNWVKLGLAFQVIVLAPAAWNAFASLQAASSAQLFLFVSCMLGCLGCVALVCSLEPGGWRSQARAQHQTPSS